MQATIVVGIGIKANNLMGYLKRAGIIDALMEHGLSPQMKQAIEASTDDEELLDALFPLCSTIAELCWLADESDMLNFANASTTDSCWLLYMPHMPWEVTDRDPKTADEVTDLIVKAVQRITTLPEERIRELIEEDLYLCE